MRRKIIIVAGAVLLMAVVIFNLVRIGLTSLELHVQAVAESMYEFHERTGRWPTSREDLATTTLPRKYPHALQGIDDGWLVPVWPTKLEPRPADNAGVILVYHGGNGLLAWFGSVVCRGDLTTAYLSWSTLRAELER